MPELREIPDTCSKAAYSAENSEIISDRGGKYRYGKITYRYTGIRNTGLKVRKISVSPTLRGSVFFFSRMHLRAEEAPRLLACTAAPVEDEPPAHRARRKPSEQERVRLHVRRTLFWA